jgi:tetratricopeptide (TPR) repeat protein
VLSAYARARAADSFGAADQAARGYAAALDASPDNSLLAARTLSQAIAAGNRPLALRAARILDQSGLLAPDGRLMLLSEAVRVRDWKAANAHIDRIEQNEIFAFMTPVLRAWTAVSSGKGDALALLNASEKDPLAASYVEEHRPLLQLALGKKEEGLASLLKLTEAEGGRGQRLRIAGAALMARKGDKASALALLAGDAPALVAARKLVERGKAIPGEIASAPAGIAELLIRVAVDLHRQDVANIALSFGRLATFLAPDNSEGWLVTSDLLNAQGQRAAALAVLANIAPHDPYAGAAEDGRIRLLVASGNQAAALKQAEAAVKAPQPSVADWTRLGDLYGELKRYGDAADAYSQAVALARQGSTTHPEWTLQLLLGGSLEEAGRWPEAKAALEAAYKLAPDQPIVLNYLGYAQLERRENIQEAEKLIREASRLQPDSAEITDSLGWAHYLRGSVATAIPLLEKAAEGQPADPAIKEHLGDAYYSVGRRFEARYAWEAALLYAQESDAKRLRAKIEVGLRPDLASP